VSGPGRLILPEVLRSRRLGVAAELRRMKAQSDERAVRLQLVRSNGGLGTGYALAFRNPEREGHRPGVRPGHEVTGSCGAVRVTTWIGKVLSLPQAR
jgi:hypothetical protein